MVGTPPAVDSDANSAPAHRTRAQLSLELALSFVIAPAAAALPRLSTFKQLLSKENARKLTEARGKHTCMSTARKTAQSDGRKRKACEEDTARVKKSKGVVAADATALHPFDHDPADDCETCFQAYQDICPFLTKLAQRLGKNKKDLW